MCGIAALALREPCNWAPKTIEEMLSLQRHRGPDAIGFEADSDKVSWIGHTRLAVMDLRPAGDQPVVNEDRTVLAVVNGEIYNAPALRRQLEAAGHRFRSRSDSEVVVHLYEEHGHDLLTHLHGMFAFVLQDRRKREILCGRDRVGKKPLLYAETVDGVAIASELPALLRVPGVDRRYDEIGLSLYLLRNFRHIPDPFTLYRGARKLEPGHAMVIRDGRVTDRWRYADVTFGLDDVSPKTVLATFDRAVEARLMSDVEIGALLSGGVDSTAIVDAMVRLGRDQVRTYALGRDTDDTELRRARRAAALLGTRHREVHFSPDEAHERYARLQRINGEPVALLPLVMANILFDHVRRDGLKVVMTGHGADESFYGYTGFLRLAQLTDLIRYLPDTLRPAAALVARYLPSGAAREGALVASRPPGRRKSALYGDEARRRLPDLVRADPEHVAYAVSGLFDTWFTVDGPPTEYIDEAASIGLMHENSHSVTIAADLPAMAESIEVRAPFLDAELLALSRTISYRQKVGSDEFQLKRILKSGLEARLPHDLLYASKQGFGFNLAEADILGGPWAAQVRAGLAELGDLDGVLRSGAAEHVWTAFKRNPDLENTITTAKLYALSLSVDAEGGN